MEIGKTLYAADRKAWRAWLKKNHSTAAEIWLVSYRKHTGKPTLPYNDAVEEALCFGWIDSIVKKVDNDSYAQRFTPRRQGSSWSELNRERLRRLVRKGKVPSAYLPTAKAILGNSSAAIAPDIIQALRQDKEVWRNFSRFPAAYRRIRIAWIEGARGRQQFQQRLQYFLRKTKVNKKFGMMR